MGKAIMIAGLVVAGVLWARYGISGEIHEASAAGDLPRIEALLDQSPALANEPGAAGLTPLLFAVEAGKSDAALLLLSRGADPKAKDRHGATALHLAARDGEDAVVKALLSRHAALEAKDVNGYTPLWYAVMGQHGKSHASTARLLIGAGADQWVTVPGGATLLHAAVLAGSQDLIELLVENSADLHAEGDVMVGDRELAGVTPIGLAAYRGSTLAIEIMLGGECDLNATDSRGRTPLMLAAQGLSGQAIVHKLIKEGAKPGAHDKEGRNALHYAVMGWKASTAAQADKEAAVRALVAAGVQVNQPDASGITPLRLAANNGDDALVKLLTQLGAV